MKASFQAEERSLLAVRPGAEEEVSVTASFRVFLLRVRGLFFDRGR